MLDPDGDECLEWRGGLEWSRSGTETSSGRICGRLLGVKMMKDLQLVSTILSLHRRRNATPASPSDPPDFHLLQAGRAGMTPALNPPLCSTEGWFNATVDQCGRGGGGECFKGG